MKLALAALFAFAALGTSAQAQETFRSEDERQIERCLNDAADGAAREACAGVISETCTQRPAVETTQNVVMCAARERQAWLSLLNTYADRLRATERDMQRALLEEALTAGEAWEIARCRYDGSYFEGGSLERMLIALCARDSTARRATDLWTRLKQYEQG